MNLTDDKKIGTVSLCKITAIKKNHFEVITPEKELGIVLINEASDYFVNDLNDIISVGDVIYLIYKERGRDNKWLFSFKERRSHYLRTPFEFDIQQNVNRMEFEKLFNFTNEEIKKWKK